MTLIKLKHILNIIKEYIINFINKIKIRGDEVAMNVIPDWLAALDDEDINFIKKFILASGSLKEIAGIYSVTYPTVRLRLDRLIQKIKISEDTTNDPFVALIKRLAVNEKLDFDTAKILISEYKKQRNGSDL